MAYCFIISSNIDFVNSSNKFVEKFSYFKPVKVLLRDTVYTHWIESYKSISEKFAAIPFANLSESVVLVDEYFNMRKSNLIENNVDTHVFWGRMIISFPELKFLFLNRIFDGSKNIIDWLINETQPSKNTPFAPLFDYSGVRNEIKQNCNSILEVRTHKARIIEDESSYAYFHAYIAYKKKHLCKLYTTLNHLESETEKNEVVQLQIQDLSLGFLDKREDIHLLDMSKRYKKFAFLKKVIDARDFVITIGQEFEKVKAKYIFIEDIKKAQKIVGVLPGKKSIIVGKKKHFIWLTDSEITLKECEYCKLTDHALNHKLELIYKPTKGMFDIKEKLKKKSDENVSSQSNQKSGNKLSANIENDQQTQSKLFVLTTDAQQRTNGHSAPGVLAFLAESLIARSLQILDSAKQVVDAIHAATLALEAKELLNGLTPTLALQAFTLQQKAEVMAECLFVGTEYNIDLKPRFIEIANEVDFISQRFAKSERKRVRLNTQLIIAEVLSGVYNNHKQFEEELGCLNKARDLKFKLRGKIFARPLLCLSWAMTSIRNFGIFLLLIQVFFAFFYYMFWKWHQKIWVGDFTWNGVSAEMKTISISIFASTKYFFTTETSERFVEIFKDHESFSNIIRGFQGFCALSSLSIFVAMIYLRFSRK